MNNENDNHFLFATVILFAIFLGVIALFVGEDMCKYLKEINMWNPIIVVAIILNILIWICVITCIEINKSQPFIVNMNNINGLESMINKKTLIFDDSVTHVHEKSFSKFNSLEKVCFYGDNLNVSKNAFWECKKLKAIYFYGNVDKLGEYCFSNGKIKKVYFNGTKKDWDNIVGNSGLAYKIELYNLNDKKLDKEDNSK